MNVAGTDAGLGGAGPAGGASANGASAGRPPLAFGGATACVPKTCAELGWACGSTVNECGTVTNCADEGRSCGPLEVCVGGTDKPTQCVTGFGACSVCSAIPDCSQAAGPTRLVGRVVTPGRSDDNIANQVGVPNAVVYILRNNDPAELPAIGTGIPMGGTSCDRCEEQALGPSLIGAVTDATGQFVLEGSVPVGAEFLLVVKVGKFRRVVRHTLPATAACQTTNLPTTLPDNPTRLPRSMDDGLAVNIPAVAVTTGELDAMECVFEKMGLAHTEFGNPVAGGTGSPRVHLYRGGPMAPGQGATIDENTPHDVTLYSDLAKLQSYDLVIADCEGETWDSRFAQRNASGDNVREYVNRGGRMFTSHLGYSWLHENGEAEFDATDPIATGLGPAATWRPTAENMYSTGVGVIATGRPNASPRLQNFTDWMANERVITPPDETFPIAEPRRQATALGALSEEFVFLEQGEMTQQFSFNTPYGAPAEAACGRVAYSGFHVSVGDTSDAVFPAHCTGDLTAQEKVLLYMLFDLGACVGVPPPPPDCVPVTCESEEVNCGLLSDGCGNVVSCGECPPPR